MASQSRVRRKKQMQSRRKNRYSLEERHKRGISATARAKVRLAEKLARKKAAAGKK
jgi:hypothetical protein